MSEESTCKTPLVLLSILLTVILSACGTNTVSSIAKPGTSAFSTPDKQAPDPTDLGSNHRLTVYAAASLTDAFLEIGRGFEAAHPGIQVDFSFAGSQILRTQLEQGAGADVVAFADQKNMDLLIGEHLVAADASQDFATNQMIVILPPTNPGKVESLEDLTKPRLKLVLADTSVPAGEYARQILSNLSKDPAYGPDFGSKVIANLVSNETDVRQVVTKVELGDADVGIVYGSDVTAVKDLGTIPIPDKYNVTAQYPIAVLTHSANPDLAAQFVLYVTSPPGQLVMRAWGFSQVGKP